jgi:hypothetical protein
MPASSEHDAYSNAGGPCPTLWHPLPCERVRYGRLLGALRRGGGR